ncbi:hypothetical protein INT45_011473 [Circinella minor]|uniref:Uncharacterized protein n=1 Tax=Circinella minor TaxID=1195481 RepID=A0A8H7RYZ8_9FUNG|nr:hypothetical protein INT45_011473 [Circinella minor]
MNQPPLSPRQDNKYNHVNYDDTLDTFQSVDNERSSLLHNLERKTLAITPPLDEIKTPSSFSNAIAHDYEPMQYHYLLNLFTAPDMRSYLARAHFTEDVYMLPIHLQRLMSEAKEEIICGKIKKEEIKKHNVNPIIPQEEQKKEPNYNATQRLERLREYVWARSGHDISNIMRIIYELIEDEDELVNILNYECPSIE